MAFTSRKSNTTRFSVSQRTITTEITSKLHENCFYVKNHFILLLYILHQIRILKNLKLCPHHHPLQCFNADDRTKKWVQHLLDHHYHHQGIN